MSTTPAASDTAAASSFSTAMDHVAQGFEALGASILVVGVVWSFVLAVLAWRKPGAGKQAYTVLRQAFGGTLLLALEILVAADLVRTVAVSPTLDNVVVLGVIVLIRTVLSFSLEIEIEGVLPWRRALASGAGTIKQATRTAFGPAGGDHGRAGPPSSLSSATTFQLKTKQQDCDRTLAVRMAVIALADHAGSRVIRMGFGHRT